MVRFDARGSIDAGRPAGSCSSVRGLAPARPRHRTRRSTCPCGWAENSPGAERPSSSLELAGLARALVTAAARDVNRHRPPRPPYPGGHGGVIKTRAEATVFFDGRGRVQARLCPGGGERQATEAASSRQPCVVPPTRARRLQRRCPKGARPEAWRRVWVLRGWQWRMMGRAHMQRRLLGNFRGLLRKAAAYRAAQHAADGAQRGEHGDPRGVAPLCADGPRPGHSGLPGRPATLAAARAHRRLSCCAVVTSPAAQELSSPPDDSGRG